MAKIILDGPNERLCDKVQNCLKTQFKIMKCWRADPTGIWMHKTTGGENNHKTNVF
jgi:hypothetical protein